MAEFSDFQKLDIRVGRHIIEVKDFPEANKPSYRLRVGLGQELGIYPPDGVVLLEPEQEVALGSKIG